MIRLHLLHKTKFEVVQISNNFESFEEEEINILYENEIALALSTEQYALFQGSGNIIEHAYFEECDVDIIDMLNHEVVRALHDVTISTFNMKTDGKKSTILKILEGNDSAYLEKLLMQLRNLHSIFNSKGNGLNTYEVNVN